MTEEHHQADDNYDEKIEKMVSLTVSAARGDIPEAQISMTLAQISAGTLAPPEARNLARSLLHILQGERDPIILVEEVTPELYRERKFNGRVAGVPEDDVAHREETRGAARR